jgi:hypothetical protein
MMTVMTVLEALLASMAPLMTGRSRTGVQVQKRLVPAAVEPVVLSTKGNLIAHDIA